MATERIRPATDAECSVLCPQARRVENLTARVAQFTAQLAEAERVYAETLAMIEATATGLEEVEGATYLTRVAS